jgi:two-component system nitrate/nitrite response regulator NarL
VVSILIVDDHDYMRSMVRALLQAKPEWQVCGEASNGLEAIDQCALLKPQVIILNIHMPVMNGLDAARQILPGFPQILILILTLDGSPHFVLAAAACGAQGLLTKSRASEQLVAAVATLLRGETYFPSLGPNKAAAGSVSAHCSHSSC